MSIIDATTRNRCPAPTLKTATSNISAGLKQANIDFQNRARHPSEFQHKHIQASYYAMIEFLDHEFGRLLDFLDETGQRENTIVIFMSDHGEMLGDHGLVLKGCRFYEGLARVPLMISWLGTRFSRRFSRRVGGTGGHRADAL